MSKHGIRASVRAQVTVELHVGCWGGAATFDELHKQCTREAIVTIQNKLADKELTIIGEPTISVSVFSAA